MKPQLTLITNTSLTKQVWQSKKETVVRVLSKDAFTISRQNEEGTQVEVHTKLGIVLVNF